MVMHNMFDLNWVRTLYDYVKFYPKTHNLFFNGSVRCVQLLQCMSDLFYMFCPLYAFRRNVENVQLTTTTNGSSIGKAHNNFNKAGIYFLKIEISTRGPCLNALTRIPSRAPILNNRCTEDSKLQ